jgi:soluble lytic murein transglycosylase-like protein
MKKLRVVLNLVLHRNSWVASLSSYAACFAIAALSLSDHHSFLQKSKARVSLEAAERARDTATSVRVALTGSTGDATRIEFVSTIIKQELPARTDSDELARIIVTESRKADIDPLFVAAIVRAESMFARSAVSHRGAKGLMQLMPATGRYLSKVSNIELKAINDLHNPETNIKLGIWYLKYLERRFSGSRERQLVAYNWGPTNLLRALSSGTSFPRESMQYVEKVLSRHSLWSNQLAQDLAVRSQTALG